MKIMNRIPALVMFFVLSAAASYGCTCIGPGDAKEAVELSEAVFSGRVIKASEFKAEVEVESVWKGNFRNTRVTVFNPAPNTSCSIALVRSQRYIVFASADKERGRVTYMPKICFPTSILAKAEKTLKEIGAGKPVKKRRKLAS